MGQIPRSIERISIVNKQLLLLLQELVVDVAVAMSFRHVDLT